jgi:hypothetical protein
MTNGNGSTTEVTSGQRTTKDATRANRTTNGTAASQPVAAGMTVVGGVLVDFLEGGQLEFRGNVADSPAIVPRGQGGRPSKGLTIMAEGGGEIPMLNLCATQAQVTGSLTVRGRIDAGADLWTDANIGGGSWKPLSRVAYRKDTEGTVHLQGALFGGDKRPYVMFFQLEPGCRPTSSGNAEAFVMTKGWAYEKCSLELNADGWIKIASQALRDDACLVLLNGISFKAADAAT